MPATTQLPRHGDALAALNRDLEALPLEDFLGWSLETFGEQIAHVTSLGPSGLVILDHLMRLRAEVRVISLDTGFLFPETHALREAVEGRYGLRLEVVRPALTPQEQESRYGPRLWELEPDICCDLRKVQPMAQALDGLEAWYTGIRRDQGPTRAQTALVAWDSRFHLFKLSPLAAWTRAEVWEHIHAAGIPYNALHDRGYTSIGCTHCTRPARSETDERSGRWAGLQKTECGLHWAGGQAQRGGVPLMKTYPVNLVLEDRLVLLIGGKGEIAHKPAGLLEAGARVRVIAPSVDAEIARLAERGEIEWLQRRYAPGDLAGAAVVFAATRNPDVHAQIWAEGAANGQLVNVMDVIDKCNFHGVSYLRRGQLTIAVGTGGAAPALAVTLRKRFEAEFGEEYTAFLEFAGRLRPEVSRRIPSFKRRTAFWYAFVESDALSLLREDREADVRALAESLLDLYAAPAALTPISQESDHEPAAAVAPQTA